MRDDDGETENRVTYTRTQTERQAHRRQERPTSNEQLKAIETNSQTRPPSNLYKDPNREADTPKARETDFQ